MARPLRIEFSGAIYHVMARGNGRQLLFHEDRDYQRMTEGLKKTVERTGWDVFAFVWMPNHIHLFFRTPQPNLSKGMQYLLSGYANWYAKRHRRTGHLFQGRFKGELIEEESYFWAVSRYLHLNPVRGKRPLVEHPRDWRWSSYPGYANRRNQVDFVAYDTTYAAWQGEFGGKDPAGAYRRFVVAGMANPPTNPLLESWEGWLLGSEAFLKQIKTKLTESRHVDQLPQARQLAAVDPTSLIQSVADYFGENVELYRLRRSPAAGRDLAAYLAHRRTTATLRELAETFGLTHPDSVSNLIRRAEHSPQQRKIVKTILEIAVKTVNRV